MNKKVLIITGVILFVIIIAVVLYFVLRPKKDKQKEDLQKQLDDLKAQLNNPATTTEQKKSIADQIALVQQQISGIIETVQDKPATGQAPSGFPIKSGSSEKTYIENIQKATNRKCNSRMAQLLIEDGKWGQKTQAAVQMCYGVTQVDWPLYQKMMSGESGYAGQGPRLFWLCPQTGMRFYYSDKCQRSCGGNCIPVKV